MNDTLKLPIDIELIQLIKSPVITEKSTFAASTNNEYVFKVVKSANKKTIKRAIELLFEVQVDSVNTLNVRGKVRRSGRTMGKMQDWKKAYVKLKEGNTLNVMESD